MNLPPLQHDCVRDLAWAIFSPPLVTALALPHAHVLAPDFALTPARAQWLLALDRNPAPLQQHLQPSKHRFLGVYFESLWRFFLQQDHEVTLLAHNQQIIENGKTLGEFDILYHCHRRDVTVHLELAVKFYLGMPITHVSNLRSSAYWLGPNCADSLQLKISHLRSHQLALIEHDSASQWFQKVRINPTLQEVAMHGYLYYPRELDIDAAQCAPDDVSSSHLASFWLRDARLNTLLQTASWQSGRYRIVPKLEWLCTHEPAANKWLDANAFGNALAQELATDLRQPAMCEMCDEATSENTQRFFVAPQDWPALHWPRRKH